MKQIKVGIIGAGWVAGVHVEALRTVAGVEVAAVSNTNRERGRRFVERHRIPDHYTDHRRTLEREDINVVSICTPNHLHASQALEVAAAGKHLIVEKPLCLTLGEADRMIAACREAGVKLCYAEELCFVPKFVRARELAEEGAFGRVYCVRQCEKHAGPYSEWFWDPARAGGGILMDMGCHGIECVRWMLGKPRVASVYAKMDTYLHREKTEMEDHVVMILEFEGGAMGIVESSWTLKGGMESRMEVFGTEGHTRAELLLEGMGLRTYSERGYGEEPTQTRGWSFPDYEWSFNCGYPQEMAHFIECIREDQEPMESGADGRVNLEIMLAGYRSAATGRKVTLPYEPEGVERPVDLWLNRGT